MSHLTVDKIISFVSMTEINKETLELSAEVNQHICECKKCYELVNNFQLVYDEFSRMSTKVSFIDYVNDKKMVENTEDFEESL